MSGLFDLDLFESKSDDDLINMSIDSFEEDVELSDEEFETMLEATRYSSEFAKAWKNYQELCHSEDNTIKKLQNTIDKATSDAQRKKVADMIEKHKNDLKAKIDIEEKKLIKMYGNAQLTYKYGSTGIMTVRDFLNQGIADPSDYIPANDGASNAVKKDLKDHGYMYDNAERLVSKVHYNKPNKTDPIGDRKPGRYKMNESAEFAPDSNATNDVDNGETDAKISVPSKTELDSNTYNDALSKLKASFKESIDVISMLENTTVVEKSEAEVMDEMLESVMMEAAYDAIMDGVIYEQVSDSDSDAIKDIVKTLKNPIASRFRDEKKEFLTFNKEKTSKALKRLYRTDYGISLGTAGGVGGAIIGSMAGIPGLIIGSLAGGIIGTLTGVLAGSFEASSVEILNYWKTKAWQIIGFTMCEEQDISKIVNKLNKEYKDELGEYRILYAHTSLAGLSYAYMEGSPDNTDMEQALAEAYIIIIDRKLPSEIVNKEKKVISELTKVIKSDDEKDKVRLDKFVKTLKGNNIRKSAKKAKKAAKGE